MLRMIGPFQAASSRSRPPFTSSFVSMAFGVTLSHAARLQLQVFRRQLHWKDHLPVSGTRWVCNSFWTVSSRSNPHFVSFCVIQLIFLLLLHSTRLQLEAFVWTLTGQITVLNPTSESSSPDRMRIILWGIPITGAPFQTMMSIRRPPFISPLASVALGSFLLHDTSLV
jgi:hypothetical protein